MLNKTTRILIVFTILFAGFSSLKAQNSKGKAFDEGKKQILDRAFISAKERYFSFLFESKEQLEKLTKIISIDKVLKSTVYAYASRDDFEKFLNYNISYQLLDHPNAFFEADMYDPILKQTYTWDQYLSYADYVTMMYQFATDHPTICQVFSLGQSVEGRELLVAKISNNIGVQEAEPQFFYSGQIHGDELVNSILMLRLIDHLTTNYGTNEQVNRLVDNIEIWINPIANPDGVYAGGNSTVNGATRFNANAVDLNRNFPDPKDGDHPDGKIWQAETQLFMALAEEQHFVMSANSHAGSAVVNYPWDTWTVRHADDDWWQFVSHEYADTAQFYSPSGYMESYNDGITNGFDWYPINGGRQDYMNYFKQCREFTLEQSVLKMLPANELPAYWEYNRQAMLNYLEQVTYGFRGRITDNDTADPIQAKIEIEGYDTNQSYVFSNPSGYYYRPIKAGIYTFNFSAEGYQSITLNDQAIADYDSKTINVDLQKLTTGVDSDILSNLRIINPVQNRRLQVISPLNITKANIYSILGQLIFTIEPNATDLQIDLQNFNRGLYILDLEFSNGKAILQRFLVP